MAGAEVRGPPVALGAGENSALVLAVLLVLGLAFVAALLDRHRLGGSIADRAWGLVFPALGLMAMLGVLATTRRQHDVLGRSP